MYSIISHPPICTAVVQCRVQDYVRGLGFNHDFVFCGHEKKTISVIEKGAVGKERFAKLVGEFPSAGVSRCIDWRESNRELVVGNDLGKVTFFQPGSGESLFVLDAHSQSITQMQWFEDFQYLLTASKDKTVKVSYGHQVTHRFGIYQRNGRK